MTDRNVRDDIFVVVKKMGFRGWLMFIRCIGFHFWREIEE
jgi:hypothetical protein